MTIAFENKSFVVAPRSLPGTSRSHAPPLPPGAGVASARSSRREPFDQEKQHALDSSARWEKRARALAAVVRLLLALLRASGFSLAGSVRMNRSSTAMLPCRPTAPNRARTSWSSHHSRYSSPNSLPWSLTVYLGVRPARLAASSSTMQIFPAVGRLLKDARPRERRDRCSMTTATHQQNGQDCSREKGNQLVQKGVEHLADC